MLRKLRMISSLNMRTLLLFIEAYLYLGLARLLIIVPFAKVAPTLGVTMEETTLVQDQQQRPELNRVRNAIRVASRNTFWKSQCLVRAIAAMKMLERRRIESTLYLGTRKDETGKMIAHAWLRSGPYYITGAEGMEQFAVVGKFAKYIGHDGKRRDLYGAR